MILLQAPLDGWPSPQAESSLTIGVLDGVHHGHRKLIGRLDDSLASTVLTFEPHPVEILRPGTDPRLITTIEERADILASLGVSQVGVLDLGEIKELTPEEFVTKVLVERLAVKHLVVGVDFRFGKNRAGDADLLGALGSRYGFEVEAVDLVAEGPAPVSSSRIRREIESGRIEAVGAMMPVRFQVTNTVVEGDKRGRALGFPTANLEPPARKVVPAIGVYAAFAHLESGAILPSAVNVGVRPTFGEGALVVEAFILDFDGDLYGQRLTLEFVEYLRAELRFDDVDALVSQMRSDVARASVLLDPVSPTVV